jgi:diamine N-acetyltransferase
MSNITYITGSGELLDLVDPLWMKLNEHHRERSLYFAERFAKFTFQMRRKSLTSQLNRKMLRVDIAQYGESGIGYCLSTIVNTDRGKTGEIESLYVEPNHREQGIGERFMRMALDWMDENGVGRRQLGVAYGNEETFKFYQKFGFYPKVTILDYKLP